MPSQQPYRLGQRPGLDGLRGFAILLVLANHTGLPHTGRAGTVGVTAFFVLSGFLITRLLVEEHDRFGGVSLKGFYARRGLRLLPAMAGYLTVTTIVALRYGQPLDQLVYAGLYVSNIARSVGVDMRLAPHTWSLAMEEQFYIVWPLLLLAMMSAGRSRRHMLQVVVLGIVASMALRWWLVTGGASLVRLHNDPLLGGGVLLVGCLLALLIDRIPTHRFLAAGLFLGGVVIILAASPGQKGVTLYLVVVPLVTVASAGLIAVLAHDGQPGWMRAVTTWPPLRYLGRISYGLYLWHYTVYFVVKNHVTSYPLKPLLQVGIALPVAALSYHLLEAPFLRVKGRFRRQAGHDGGGDHRTGGESAGELVPLGSLAEGAR